MKRRTDIGKRQINELIPAFRASSLHEVATCFIKPNMTILHYTALHCTTLHCTALHYTTLHYTALHCTTLHSTTLHYTTLHCTALHYTALHYTTLHYTTLPCTALNMIGTLTWTYKRWTVHTGLGKQNPLLYIGCWVSSSHAILQ